jgi:4-hydroxybenzoate polyprenyltransferase
MPLTGRLFNFFIYSNLFIAGCAVCMVNQSSRLLLHTSPDTDFLWFVFFSTICSYSFHWYLSSQTVLVSHRVTWQQRNHHFHLILFIIGLLGAGYFFILISEHWPWLFLSAFITFLYSAPKIPHKHFRILKKIALGKTVFLAMVWTYVTTMLPVLITDSEWRIDFSLFTASRFFLIYAICILFDYRDRKDDKASGIRSLITYMDENGIRNLFVLSILLFTIATLSMLFYGYGLVTVIILLVPGIITGALYNYAKKNLSDVFYYFILDGLMALSALLMLVTGI